ncbi:hypothetical protein LEP1GSC170_4942 [Leptospira interrogans serovar Bataviae str. HAI135]|nr:hypothetical protein LEP1GSC170_4942 [Leptospira interrogans serovar Bataviae str. HAI135]
MKKLSESDFESKKNYSSFPPVTLKKTSSRDSVVFSYFKMFAPKATSSAGIFLRSIPSIGRNSI